jgi:hypothetical protein
MLTFMIMDNLFFDLVSQQPEKIWGYERSGFRDMRSYLNHTNVRAFWTVLPVVTVFGSSAGPLVVRSAVLHKPTDPRPQRKVHCSTRLKTLGHSFG